MNCNKKFKENTVYSIYNLKFDIEKALPNQYVIQQEWDTWLSWWKDMQIKK